MEKKYFTIHNVWKGFFVVADSIFFFMYDVVLDWGLNPGPPVAKTSTLSLGYRGGGIKSSDV